MIGGKKSATVSDVVARSRLAGWAAEREFALLMLLTDGNRKAAQQLWLRKVRIHREAPPGAGASAPKAATAKPQPAPARARAVPTLPSP
jgi:hypothetical protein